MRKVPSPVSLPRRAQRFPPTMVSVFPLSISIVLLMVGMAEVLLLSNTRMVLLPVTSIFEFDVPNVAFQAPMANVPAASRVPPLQVLAPAYVMFSCPPPVFTSIPSPTIFPLSEVVPLATCRVAVSVSVMPRSVAVLALSMISVALPICRFSAADEAAPIELGNPPSASSFTVTLPLLMMVGPV